MIILLKIQMYEAKVHIIPVLEAHKDVDYLLAGWRKITIAHSILLDKEPKSELLKYVS